MSAGDLSTEALVAVLPDRPVRVYPAVLSTEADALAWARSGAPAGAVVAAGYQVAPRGRGGVPWAVDFAHDLAFSLVLRPALPAEREGWLYVAAALGLADTIPDALVGWPDELQRDQALVGAVGVQVELGPGGVVWAVVNVLATRLRVSRSEALGRCVAAIEARLRQPPEDVLGDYLPRCATLGRRVRARMIPLGPAGPEVSGTAATVQSDGALAIDSGAGPRVLVRPQHLGILEEL